VGAASISLSHPDALHESRRSRERDAAHARGGAHRADACGGGFGASSPLAPSLWRSLPGSSADPFACVYTRPESDGSSTKRIRLGSLPVSALTRGQVLACDVTATFDTGAYARGGRPSPIACRSRLGPYAVPHVRPGARRSQANGPPAVLSAASACRKPPSPTSDDGQRPTSSLSTAWSSVTATRYASATLPDRQRLAHIGPAWCNARALAAALEEAHDEAAASTPSQVTRRRASASACMWVTASATPDVQSHRAGERACRRRTLTLYNGAVGFGQGSNTILTRSPPLAPKKTPQPCARPAPAQFALVPRPDLTPCRQDPRPRSILSSRAWSSSAPAATCAGHILRLPIPGGPELVLEGAKLTVRDGG